MSGLILSLFPGIGLLDRAFEECSDFCVVRGPDVLWGGNVKNFHPPPEKFDGIIGGPPCQVFSRLQHIVRHNHKREPDKYLPAENLIPEFVRCIEEALPTWFLMENVPGVPLDCWPRPIGFHVSTFILNNRWVPDTTPQNRNRRFWFGHRSCEINLVKFLDVVVFEPLEWEYAVTAAGSGGGAPIPVRLNSGGKLKTALRQPKSRSGNRSISDYLRLQGLPEDFFGEKTPFTVAGQKRMIGNGIPLPMGKAVVMALTRALEQFPQPVVAS